MKSKVVNDNPKMYVLVLDKGDEAVSTIERFVRDNAIGAAQMTAIGAFSDAMLGFFDWETKDYSQNPGAGAGRGCVFARRRRAGA